MYHTLLIEGDEGMADKKDNKPPDDDSPFNSSGELFETLFREELDTLTDGQKEKKDWHKETVSGALHHNKKVKDN